MIKKTVTILCDHCGDSIVTGEEKTKPARKEAKASGWSYSIFTGDICKACIKSNAEEYINAVKPQGLV